MNSESGINLVITKNFKTLFLSLFVINLVLRLVIYYNTSVFEFGDFKIHFDGIERIAHGERLLLTSGNFLFAISYIGYFFKYVLGNLDYYFILNASLGAATSAIISFLVLKVTFSKNAAILTMIILSFYTEFMVFSSVFYTSVITIFLLSLFILVLYFYYYSGKVLSDIAFLSILGLILCLTFFFKQELIFVSIFLAVLLLLIRKNNWVFRKTLILTIVLGICTVGFYKSGILSKPEGDILVNDFAFFGHTDYGGDMGEGAFIYPENKARYVEALNEYCLKNNIKTPDRIQINRFQREEIFRFVIHHPVKWVELQFTKFFRTFGVVPETTSFKILYTGLLKENLWLTSIIVVAPVALIILLFILFFNLSALKQLFWHAAHGTRYAAIDSMLSTAASRKPQAASPSSDNRGFLYIYLLLFVYYIIATIFFGQYQERYRMPLMICFIIPALGYFIATFNKEQFFKKGNLIIKGSVIVLFLTIWTFQAKKAISNKERLHNAIESVE